jgi:hypothetical protein
MALWSLEEADQNDQPSDRRDHAMAGPAAAVAAGPGYRITPTDATIGPFRAIAPLVAAGIKVPIS